MASDGSESGPVGPFRINHSPLQRPGQDRLLRQVTFGGAGRDAVMVLHVEVLREWLAKAEASLSKRVVLRQCGVRVDVFEAGNGRRHEVWHPTSVDAVPESTPVDLLVRPGGE